MKKRTTKNIQPEPKLNSEQQTIDTTSAKLLPIRMLHAVSSSRTTRCQRFINLTVAAQWSLHNESSFFKLAVFVQAKRVIKF